MGKVLMGITAGTIVGATIGVMMVPTLDRKTQRKIKKASRVALCALGDGYDQMMSKIR
ncbi:YtxH domain-containing protein [Clostridium massiliamazoniense]|uniref:YtxH domain-containing protein n=1 Tax=Clostridium massiliamazoniense TaxID=1347366 RepID=UPI000AC1230D|nr:YtxH domain-containing protein [Clostridium massiliamazoniense]